MNAVFKLEVISFRKLVKDFACLTSEQPPTVAEVISIVLLVRGKGTASLFSKSVSL